jgi:hypothetical protein
MMDSIKTHLKTILYGIGSLLGTVLLWAGMHREPARINDAVPAPVAPELIHEGKTDTPIQSIKTYPKSVKRKLNLPALVQADDNKQVIAASKLPADDYPQTVTTVIDTQTGEISTHMRRDSLPLFSLDTSGDAGLYIGLRNGSTALSGEARQSLFKVYAVHVGGRLVFDQSIGGSQQPPSTFIGGGAWGNW